MTAECMPVSSLRKGSVGGSPANAGVHEIKRPKATIADRAARVKILLKGPIRSVLTIHTLRKIA
jgi:hypothetical protein